MTSCEQRSLDEIWQGDLFDRREEAVLLQAYIESVTARRPLREDKRAYTIAIDAGYGEGKSFFLKRFAEHMGVNHPVAFVDAWADDLADQPLTALAATLNEALKPFMAEPEIKSRVATFMSKSGQVAKIAGLGLVRRGVATLLTAGAVDDIGGVLAGSSEAVKSSINDSLKDVGQGLTDDTAAAISSVSPHDLMQARIAEFEHGRAAVQAMKDSLSSIVDALDRQEKHPPIIIVIDELDRCRPTYAIKLLEEIKHLFDVPGLVFVLGIHTEQLAHSVVGAYGHSFDGKSYLRRFINRQYDLAVPNHYKLIKHLCEDAGIGPGDLRYPNLTSTSGGESASDLYDVIAIYMQLYGLAARDTFPLIDILQTSLAVAGQRRLHAPLLLPLAIGQLRSLPAGVLPVPRNTVPFAYTRYIHRSENSGWESYTIERVAADFLEAASITQDRLAALYNENSPSFGVETVANERDWRSNPPPLGDISRYPDLIRAVGRFGTPK